MVLISADFETLFILTILALLSVGLPPPEERNDDQPRWRDPAFALLVWLIHRRVTLGTVPDGTMTFLRIRLFQHFRLVRVCRQLVRNFAPVHKGCSLDDFYFLAISAASSGVEMLFKNPWHYRS